MTSGRGRWRSRFLVMGVVPPVFLMAGFTWVHTWYPVHIRTVTGRSDVPEVSCFYCHGRKVPPPIRGSGSGTGTGFPSPEGMAISPDGGRLYVAATGTDELIELDLAGGRVLRATSLPGRPHGVAITGDGGLLAVSCRDADRVVLLDTKSLSATGSFEAGPEPLGLSFSRDGKRLFVAGGLSDDLLIADLESPVRSVRLVAGNEPYAVSLSRDGSLLAAASRLAHPVTPGIVPFSEVTLVDAVNNRIHERRILDSAHLSEGVAVASDGSFVLATAIHVRNLLPLTQVSRGAVMNSTIVFIETSPGGRAVQFPLATVNSFYADPSGIAITPDDRIAFVAHAGADTITVVDIAALREIMTEPALDGVADDLSISSRYVLARIATGDAPRTLVLSASGETLYVAEHLADSIAVIDVTSLEVSHRIPLAPPREPTAERRGERIFHDGSKSFQGQFSCRSCHPDGHSDGLIWDFEIDGIGRNLVDTRSLRGVRDTAPFKWNGKNKDLATQCGPRFARVLTRTDPFSEEQLEDLVAYIESIPLSPRRLPPDQESAREAGQRLFFRTHTSSGEEIPVANRCKTCHRPPLFTDRLPADVGTGGPFDTPHLLDLSASPPYLHDGRSPTLEEIWTVHSPEDTHGVTTDLTKVELNELIIYLRSL